jgi:hypothetical protein
MSTLIHPELIELFTKFKLADLDYEDNKGSRNVYEFAERASQARLAFRTRREELEAEGVQIWGEDDA